MLTLQNLNLKENLPPYKTHHLYEFKWQGCKILDGKENIPLENLLIVTDDINLPLGKLRIRKNGNDGGHNGLKISTNYCKQISIHVCVLAWGMISEKANKWILF